MRTLLVTWMVLALAACTSGDIPDSRPRYYGVSEAGAAGERLIPYTTLAGYMVQAGTRDNRLLRALTGVDADRSIFIRPIAVDASPYGVFVIDDTTRALYRFRWQIADAAHRDPPHVAEAHLGLSHPDFSMIASLRDLGEPIDLYASDAGDVYVADGDGKRVIRYDSNGVRLQELSSVDHLNRPVAVTADSRGLRIFIADGLFDRIVVFNPAGRSLYGIGERGDQPGQLNHLRDMIQGPDGLLYVVDGVNRRINVFGLDGSFVEAFGHQTFTDAGGITVDEDGRVYVSDRFNHRLLIFKERKVVEIYGGPGPDPGEFNQPVSLAYFEGKLYVADRENSRIQVFRVVPERIVAQSSGGPS